MRRTSSTHGPVALTTQVALTASAPPPSTSVQSAPATRPPASRSAPHLDARGDAGARERRGPRDGDRHARVVGLVIDVAPGRAQAGGAQRRHERARGARAQQAPTTVLEAPESAVEHEPGPQLRRSDRPTAVDGNEERARPHEVRGDDPRERVPLRVRLAHEADVAHLQVAQPAVDELGGGTRRGPGEVTALHQRDAQPGPRPEPGDRAAHDAAADDEQVEPAACERLEHVVACRAGREGAT